MTHNDEYTIWNFENNEWKPALRGIEVALINPIGEVIIELEEVKEFLKRSDSRSVVNVRNRLLRIIEYLRIIKDRYKLSLNID